MGDDRRFDLRRRQAVAGDVDHVVDTAEDPEVAVLVLARGVADEVGRLAELLVVGLLEPVVLPEEGAENARPGPPQDQKALLAVWNLLAVVIDHGGIDAGQGLGRRARLGRDYARERA